MSGLTAEVEQPCTNGSTVWTEVTISLIRNRIGSVSYVLGISRNISERKRAEQALLDSEKRYRRLVESVTDYIYTVRVENGRPVETTHSPGCLAVTGYRPEDYAREPLLWHRMIHEEDRETVSEQSARILARDTVSTFEHRIVHRDGSVRWVKHTPVPRYDGKGGLIAWDGLISDITERKNLEEQLRQAQKMEAIGQLAGGIAHDFNNILSAIIGYGTLLQMETEKDDELRASIDPILDAADRAANLTHSLLAFSRNQLLKTEPVDLNDIVRHVEKLLSRIIGEDIELRTRLREEPVMINADRGQIEQVLMNLATNARDAMSRGGAFVIETDTSQLQEHPAESAGTLKPGWYAVLSVSDTGMGMDEATQKKAFEPFFTTKESRKGTGLGLSMVYGIVQQHHGSITLRSEQGKGSLFKLHIPLLNPKEAARPLRMDAHEAVPRGSETVLVAEDDDAIRELSQTVLTASGYHVIEARNGEEAVEQFRKYKDGIRMVLLDMIMPKMSGREAYEEIRKIGGDVKVLFVSGYTADKVRGGDALPGNAVILNKPVLPRQLLKKIRDLLDS
jgi:PAS domain S-box-containing protein